MITTERVKNNKAVRYGSLSIGETFLWDNRPCMIVDRNGHSFPIEIATGRLIASITPETSVCLIDCHLTYSIR